MNWPWLKKKGRSFFRPSGAQLSVVAQAGMRIQRKMGAIDRQVVLEQKADEVVALPRPWVGWSPEESMVHQQQVGPRRCCQPSCGQTGVHRRRDAGHVAAIFDLQAVGS